MGGGRVDPDQGSCGFRIAGEAACRSPAILCHLTGDPDLERRRWDRKLGAKVYLVPHSSGFSRWLDRWERERGVGVIAVACMLNILPGGYDMRSRRIASQCLPLDYPGCKKHWDKEGSPTAVNEDRLVRIITGAR